MTKSLSSNIVKWNYINFEKEEKHVIDSDARVDLLAEILSVPKKTAKAVATAASGKDGLNFSEGGFREGIFAENVRIEAEPVEAVDEELEEQKMELLKEAEAVLTNARQEAEQILEAARAEAESIKDSAYNFGKNDGYKDGLAAGQKELITLEMQLKDQAREWEDEFNQKLLEAEPQFVDIMISLIEKITGVIIENKREVILHLVHNAMQQIGRSARYIIHCSSEDYTLLEGEKERLCNAIGLSAEIEILEEPEYVKNQCIIETDSTIIDCSLDIQLKNLIENLKLLSIS